MLPNIGHGQTRDEHLTIIHTGSIATVKAIELYMEAQQTGFEVENIILSPTSFPFFIDSILRNSFPDTETYQQQIHTYTPETQLGEQEVRGIVQQYFPEIQKKLCFGENDFSASFGQGVRDIEHITRARTGNILVAPASANTLAKIVSGITDSFALETIRAFNPSEGGKVFLAPAMNTQMLHDPATQRVLQELRTEMFSGKYVLLPTVAKTLACGEIGDGAMLPVGDMIKALKPNIEKNIT